MDYIGVATNLLDYWTQTEYGAVIKLVLITIPIVIYAVFIFYFYRFLAKKNLLELNLNQYNKYSVGPLLRVMPILFYILEYIIILPIITFFWFAILSILVFFLAPELSLDVVLLISAALIASVRVTSYVSENLSQDLAKMLPLTLLGLAITKPTFFNLTGHLSRIIEIPTLFNDVISFLVFIIIIELIMRVFDLIRRIGHEAKAMKGTAKTEDEDDDDD